MGGAKVLSPLPKFPNSSRDVARVSFLRVISQPAVSALRRRVRKVEDIAVAFVCRSVPLFLGQIRRLARLVVFCRTGTESGGVAVAVIVDEIVDRRRGRVCFLI